MSSVWLPCGDYHQYYQEDQGWWQSTFIKMKMILLLLSVFVGIPLLLPGYYLSVATMVGYTAMGALGVQLLIGYTGLVTLGHVGKKSGRGFYLWENGEIVGENPAARRQPV